MTGGHAAASVAMSDPGSSGSSSHLPINPHPDIIMTNVTIFHPQLRDLLQPAGEKGKVLFINRMNIDCADFNTMKVREEMGARIVCILDTIERRLTRINTPLHT